MFIEITIAITQSKILINTAHILQIEKKSSSEAKVDDSTAPEEYWTADEPYEQLRDRILGGFATVEAWLHR